jgi:hypothetical protein
VEELDVPETTNEPGADADISGLQTAARAKEEGINEGEKKRAKQ